MANVIQQIEYRSCLGKTFVLLAAIRKIFETLFSCAEKENPHKSLFSPELQIQAIVPV